nr:4Fe-4S ferredoxin [Geobacteraceae bacterium]
QAGGCPDSRIMTRKCAAVPDEKEQYASRNSRLAQWPIQLRLVPVGAPFLENADLLIAADCSPFAYADFHRDFLAGKALVVGCPKLDDNRYYTEKLADIFQKSPIRSVTLVRMEVPCCGGIEAAAKRALVAAERNIPLKVVTVGMDGTIR